MWQLAQDLPDPALLQGNVQEILVWVVLAQIALLVLVVGYFVRRESKWETKYDALQGKMIKSISRSNRAMEAVAKLPPPAEEAHDA